MVRDQRFADWKFGITRGKGCESSRNPSSRFDLSRQIEERPGPLIHFEGRRYREFRYREKGVEWSSNFMKHEVPICEQEIRTIRRGDCGPWIWQVELTSSGFRRTSKRTSRDVKS
jgi:hypothetical protein